MALEFTRGGPPARLNQNGHGDREIVVLHIRSLMKTTNTPPPGNASIRVKHSSYVGDINNFKEAEKIEEGDTTNGANDLLTNMELSRDKDNKPRIST